MCLFPPDPKRPGSHLHKDCDDCRCPTSRMKHDVQSEFKEMQVVWTCRKCHERR